jgi:hypothetical protein
MSDNSITLPKDAHLRLGEIASEINDLRFPLRFLAGAACSQLDSPMDDGFRDLMDRMVADLERLSGAVFSIYKLAQNTEEVRANV